MTAEPLVGVCLGADDDGALLLDTPAGVQRILSGDVSLRPVGEGALGSSTLGVASGLGVRRA